MSELSSGRYLKTKAFQQVSIERNRQDKKWGSLSELPSDRLPDRWLSILGEEFGEVSEAVCELGSIREEHEAGEYVHPKYEELWSAKLEKELVQVAAVAVAWLEWIEHNR